MYKGLIEKSTRFEPLLQSIIDTPAEYVQYYQNKMINREILPEATDEDMFINKTKSDRINQKNIPSSSV